MIWYFGEVQSAISRRIVSNFSFFCDMHTRMLKFCTPDLALHLTDFM